MSFIMGDFSPIDAISAGSGVIGSIINAFSQKASNKAYLKGINDTNATNLQIQRETNKQNLDMFNASNAFNERMWNLENSYNSPVAQRARMIQAGINPSDIASGTASSIQSTAGIPAQAAKMNAPGQTLIPDYGSAFRALGGSVREYKENQLLDEQIKQSRLSTSMKETDRAFYYGEKERRAKKEAADILGQEYKNESDWIRLQDLNDEINYLKVMRNKTQRAADDEHDLAVKRGDQISADINKTLDDIRHMQESDRISWFNARSAHQVNLAQVNQMRESTRYQHFQNRFLDINFNVEASAQREEAYLRSQVAAMGQQQAQVLLTTLLSNAEVQRRMKDAPVRLALNYIFGIDIQQAFSGVGTVSVGEAVKNFFK